MIIFEIHDLDIVVRLLTDYYHDYNRLQPWKRDITMIQELGLKLGYVATEKLDVAMSTYVVLTFNDQQKELIFRLKYF